MMAPGTAHYAVWWVDFLVTARGLCCLVRLGKGTKA